MSIKFNDVLKLAHARHTMPVMRSVVFDGKSAMTAAPLDWMVGVPCPQPTLTEPVVVPADAITAHLLKSRHLIVMPDHLSNGQGMVTPFNKKPSMNWEQVLDMLPRVPQGAAASFDLELDALDRVLVAAGVHDIRYYLNGILMDLSNGMLVGTNGHQLHAYKNRVPVAYKRKLKDGMPVSPVVEVIFQSDPLRWITHSASAAARVTIWDAKRDEKKPGQPVPQILLQTDDGFVWVRKSIEGKFPDYARVIPSNTSRPVWLELDPVKLSDTVHAMGKLAKLKSEGKYESVRIDFGRRKVGLESGGDTMPLEVGLHTDDKTINFHQIQCDLWMGFHAPYVQDVADCVTPAAQWRIDHTNCKNSSLLVVDGDFSGVVMPLRMNEMDTAPKKAAAEPETAPEAAQVPETASEAATEPEAAQDEPCPAAVSAMAAQLVATAQESSKRRSEIGVSGWHAKKARKPAKKVGLLLKTFIEAVEQAEKTAQAEPVAA